MATACADHAAERPSQPEHYNNYELKIRLQLPITLRRAVLSNAGSDDPLGDHDTEYGARRVPDQSRVFFANPLSTFHPKERMNSLISDLNDMSMKNPITLYWIFMGSRIGSFFMFCNLLPLWGILQGPELALGWVAARVTCKLRQPANLALAATITRLFPVLSTVKASAMLGSISLTRPASTLAPTASTCLSQRMMDQLEKSARWLQGPVDKYGMAWYISTKVTMLSTLLGCSVALQSGLDVVALFNGIGISLAVQEGVSGMAGAALANTALLPLHLLLAVRLTPTLAAVLPSPESFDEEWSEHEEESQGRGREGAVSLEPERPRQDAKN